MLWLLILLTCMLVLLMYILFAPLYIDVNSSKDLYQVRFHRLLSFKILTSNNLVIELKVAGWKKRIDFSERASYKPQKKDETPKPTERKVNMNFRKIISVLRSFKVKTFEMSLDSGNRQLNGTLFPLFYVAGLYFGRNIRISFTGETYFILSMKNTLGRMTIAYLWPSL